MTTSCSADNSVSSASTTKAGDPLQLVVQYVRNGTEVSAAAPLTVTLTGPGLAKSTTEAGLQSGLGLRSSVSATDTLSPTGSAVTLTRTTSWDDALFETRASETLPGLGGQRVTVPSYEPDYEPTDNQWKRPIASRSPGLSTSGLSYWNNAEAGPSGGCDNTVGVVQAGQEKTRVYPSPSDGRPSGLARSRAYDAAGRLAGFSAVPEGVSASSEVRGCQHFDGRGRRTQGSVEAYKEGTTGGGAMSQAWHYPNQTDGDGFTTTLTYTWEAPVTAPGCATESEAPYTCKVETATDLLGRTIRQTDVWGNLRSSTYVLAPSTGVLTQTDTLALSDRTVTTTQERNRLGNPLSLTRTDSRGAPTLSITYGYDEFGRTQTVQAESGGSEVVTATYRYDSQNRVSKVTWTQGGKTVLENGLTLADNSPRTLGESFVYGSASYDYKYTFNDAGWLTKAALSGTDEQSNAVSGSWTYGFERGSGSNADAYLNGNVTEVTTTGVASGPSGSLAYDYFDRVQGTGVKHDGLGNLLSYGNDTLVYDQTNQVTSLSDGTTSVTFERTPQGDVIQKSTGANAIRYALDGVILDDTGAPTSQTVSAGTLLVTLDLSQAHDDTFTVTSLQGGHATLALDASGDPVAPNQSELTLYGPWDHPVQAAPMPDDDRPLYGWQGLLRLETNLNLVLMGERMYHPDLGRFTSIDPVFQGGLTAYSYAQNDSINNTDPRGTQALSTGDIAADATIVVGTLVVLYLFYKVATSVEEPPMPLERPEGVLENIDAFNQQVQRNVPVNEGVEQKRDVVDREVEVEAEVDNAAAAPAAEREVADQLFREGGVVAIDDAFLAL